MGVVDWFAHVSKAANMSHSTLFFIITVLFLLLISDIHGYDEAGCKRRSNETYYTGINGICRLPLGAEGHSNVSEDTVPFHMNRCNQKEDKKNSLDVAFGLLACLLASVMFGSMFIPLKKFNTGDGMFFQWMMAIGILMVGLFSHIVVYNQPTFFYFSMIGGILWGTGNVLSVPTYKLVGLGVGQTMVGNMNLLSGWISGRFILCQPLSDLIKNTIGVVLIIISSIILSCVKSEGKKHKKTSDPEKRSSKKTRTNLSNSVSDCFHETNKNLTNQNANENTPLINEDKQKKTEETEDDNSDISWTDKLGKWPARVIGLSMAAISGLLYGFQFLPVELLRNCEHKVFSCNELDYVFGQYMGIFLASTFWFLVYCCVKKFKPQVYNGIIIPAIISGIMFGIGTASWFIANKFVGLSIAFPVITSCCSIVSSSWGIIVFREIRGYVNIILFIIAFLIILSGIILVGLSY